MCYEIKFISAKKQVGSGVVTRLLSGLLNSVGKIIGI